MPFDATPTQPTSLVDYLHDEGIVPISMNYLAQHKSTMLRRYRKSLWLTPMPYVLAGLTAIIGLTAITPFSIPMFTINLIFGILFTVFSFIFFSCCADIFEIKLRGSPYWMEMRWPIPMPSEIATIVQRVSTTMPRNAMLLYGELRQDKVLLDPYVIVQINGVRACLGIWVDDTVIACAKII